MATPITLVTGASSGLGVQFARAFAARGDHLVITARRRDRLEGLAAELSAKHDIAAQVVVADLSKPAGVDDLQSAVDGVDVTVDRLVNNAGFGSYGRFSELALEQALEMIDLNVRALVALTGCFMPQMLDRGRGEILHVASTTSFQPVPYMAVYGATKAFVLSFSEAIAQECRGTGVRVLAVCPGHTPTEFDEVSGADQRPVRTASQSATAVVREALAALDHSGTHSIVTGTSNKLTTQLPRLLPRRLFGSLIERAFRPRR